MKEVSVNLKIVVNLFLLAQSNIGGLPLRPRGRIVYFPITCNNPTRGNANSIICP